MFLWKTRQIQYTYISLFWRKGVENAQYEHPPTLFNPKWTAFLLLNLNHHRCNSVYLDKFWENINKFYIICFDELTLETNIPEKKRRKNKNRKILQHDISRWIFGKIANGIFVWASNIREECRFVDTVDN